MGDPRVPKPPSFGRLRPAARGCASPRTPRTWSSRCGPAPPPSRSGSGATRAPTPPRRRSPGSSASGARRRALSRGRLRATRCEVGWGERCVLRVGQEKKDSSGLDGFSQRNSSICPKGRLCVRGGFGPACGVILVGARISSLQSWRKGEVNCSFKGHLLSQCQRAVPLSIPG